MKIMKRNYKKRNLEMLKAEISEVLTKIWLFIRNDKKLKFACYKQAKSQGFETIEAYHMACRINNLYCYYKHKLIFV